MDKTCKKLCNECPFKKGSLPGWLGPWEPDELVDYVFRSDQAFACHKTLGDEEDTPVENHVICKGSVLFLEKNMVIPRTNLVLRTLLKSVKEEELEDIMTKQEFLNHHKDE